MKGLQLPRLRLIPSPYVRLKMVWAKIEEEIRERDIHKLFENWSRMKSLPFVMLHVLFVHTKNPVVQEVLFAAALFFFFSPH